MFWEHLCSVPACPWDVPHDSFLLRAATRFRFFLRVANSYAKVTNSGEGWILLMKKINLILVTMTIVGKWKLNGYYHQYYQELCSNTSISPVNTHSVARNIIACTSSQDTNREKVLLSNKISKAEIPTLEGIKHVFIHYFPHSKHPFHLSTENGREKFVRKGHQNACSSAGISFSKYKSFPKLEDKKNKN